MPGINKVILVGRLGADPEYKNWPDVGGICNFSIATSETWNDKATGEKRERTEWHRIVAYRKLAEICGKYLTKGKQVYVEGKLQTREWEDKDGVRRWTTEIVIHTLEMLGNKGDDAPKQGQPKSRPRGNISRDMKSGYPDDIAGQVPEVTPEDDSLPF